ncbi:protein ripply3 isoform X2 [Pelobates fuscus]|uniref:protein ripply3 isoform X2 n=1 Tax=Pelobates fuscus TaxID=191477 RepID=UPI002FE4791E
MDSVHCKLKAALCHMYPCPRGATSSIHTQHPGQPDSPDLWRPWVFSAGDRQKRLLKKSESHDGHIGSKGAHGFQHPVRLYMPKSKTNEYIENMGKKVLANFPVQATIHFYNDNSDSEEEEEDEEEYGMDFNTHHQDFDRDPKKVSGDMEQENSLCLSSPSFPHEKPHWN